MWIPARYVWSPGGYVFLAGHWDYALAKRGVVFCPVYYANPYEIAPAYSYSPSVCIETPVLTGYLFCRPAYGHYYFGDYYDPMYARVGIYPWYAVHEGRFGYEPLFVYDRWYYGRRDPGWELRIRSDYAYRVAHFEARPPHTYAAAVGISIRTPGLSVTLAVPIGHVAARGGAMHFEHLSAERREQFVREQHEIRHVEAERRTADIRAHAEARANGGQPVHATTAARQRRTQPPAPEPAKRWRPREPTRELRRQNPASRTRTARIRTADKIAMIPLSTGPMCHRALRRRMHRDIPRRGSHKACRR